MKKINIYSIDMYGSYNYEFSTLTNLNCTQQVIKTISRQSMQSSKGELKLISLVKEHNKNFLWFNKLINHSIFKSTNIIGLVASYK